MASDPRLFFKLHNGFPEHPKAIELSDKAFRQLIEAWCYCSRQLNDGKLTKPLFFKLFSAKSRKEVLSVGFVVATENGYEMHDYLEHQESAADVENRRMTRAAAGSKGGKAKANNLASATAGASGLPEQTPSKVVADKDVDRDRDEVLKRTPSPAAPSRMFDQFWDWYPRKVGKPDALKAYEKAVAKHGEQVIIAGVERLRLDPNLPEKNFIPHPATWLNREGWNDEPFPPRIRPGTGGKPTVTEKMHDTFTRAQALQAAAGQQTTLQIVGA
jgi:hypothetical protein